MRRDKRRKIIEERIRKVNQLEMELKKIYAAQNDLGYHVLDKPIRDGWYRTLKLRADIKKNKNAKIYQIILDVIVIEVWGRDKKHADKKWNKYIKKHKFGIPSTGTSYLGEKQFSKLPHKAKMEFKPISKNLYWFWQRKKVYACTLPKYFFQTHYRRAYITKFKIISSELESREQEIMEMLSSNELNKYSNYFSYNSRYWHWHNPTKKSRLEGKKLVREFTNLQNCNK